MTRSILMVALAAFAFAANANTQDIAGDWQGTLKNAPRDLRLILKIEKATDGSWHAMMFSIDEDDRGAGTPANSVTLQDSNVTLAFDAVQASYEGKVNKDGNSIEGTWTHGPPPRPLEFQRATSQTAWKDPSPHKVQFVTVNDNAKLEVLDWGGSGRPVVLLAGLGNTAHVFDDFAPKLTAEYHVYGITRRGFGASTAPASGYSADRLGDDVIAVLDALKLERPVLVGHSIAGEELSSVGSRHPERIAGLIYLDAAYPYAYYDPSLGDITIDLSELQKKLQQLQPGKEPDPRSLIQQLLETNLPGFEKDLQESQKNLQAMPPATLAGLSSAPPLPAANAAIIAGEQKYTNIPVPILAIYAIPHDLGPAMGSDPAVRAAFEARDEVYVGAQAKAFESGVPSARVVRLPHANHYVFRSNEADVLREMRTFIQGLR